MNSGIFSVGLILLLLGVFAYFYPFIMPQDENKGIFRAYSYPISIIGIILMLVGAVIPSVTMETTKHVVEPVRERVIEHESHGPHRHVRKTHTVVREE